jgi:hypothetical protein
MLPAFQRITNLASIAWLGSSLSRTCEVVGRPVGVVAAAGRRVMVKVLFNKLVTASMA